MKNIILIIVGIGIGVSGVLFITQEVIGPSPEGSTPTDRVSVSNFEECVQAGNPVMESYPRQCSHNGVRYTEELDPKDRPFFENEDGPKNFDECVEQGNQVTNTDPRVCIDDDGNPHTEEQNEMTETQCTPETRFVDACVELYAPVCARVQVECITAPCDPVLETYSNSCDACRNKRVLSYTEGECT